jgi:hypothetical protein
VLSLIILKAQSQFAIAGINAGIYVDIIPDTSLAPISYHNGGNDDEYYHLDINQNGIDDIKIHARFVVSPGASSQYVKIISLDTAIQFSYLKTDSAYFNSFCGGPGWTPIGEILTPYMIGDTIKYNKYVSSGYIRLSGSSPGCGMYYNDTTWKNSRDQYIGVMDSSSSGIQFGWIRVNNYNSMIIKDFSLGNISSGIKTFFPLNRLHIFPNPFSSETILQTNEPLRNASLTVYNSYGHTVNKIDNISGHKIIFQRENLSNGLYFIQLTEGDKIYVDKLVITGK